MNIVIYKQASSTKCAGTLEEILNPPGADA
jgi:hypothetical protein